MPDSAWDDLIDLSHSLGLTVYCDVFGLASAERMYRLGADGFMIHAADISNTELLAWASRLGQADSSVRWRVDLDGDFRCCFECLQAKGTQSVSLMHGFQKLSDPVAERLSAPHLPAAQKNGGTGRLCLSPGWR